MKNLLTLLLLTMILFSCDTGNEKISEPAATLQEASSQFTADFLSFCDDLEQQYLKWDKENYRGSYAVRALAVAYDFTNNDTYFELCRVWSDSMVDKQSRMTPPGAYYMGYNREPGQERGDWFVADASCIAMGVLATAVRCQDNADKQRYMQSVRQFADLVIERFVRASGGVTDGYWSASEDEWWCSTALFASFCFLLYEQTGESKYLQTALDATDWTAGFDYRTATTPVFDLQGAPTVVFYTLEAFSAGWPHLKGEQKAAVLNRYREYITWCVDHIEKDLSSYQGNWGSKIGGIPFHLLVYNRINDGKVSDKVEKLNSRIIDFLLHTERDDFQRTSFAVFSLCERAFTDAIYHRR